MKGAGLAARLRDRGTLVAVAAFAALAVVCFVYADRAAAGRKTTERVEAAVAEGKSIHWRQVTRVWLPRAAFVNGWLALLAAAAVPWARRPLADAGTFAADDRADAVADDRRDAVADRDEAPRVRRLGWAAMVVLAGAAAWLTAPRLSQSVWGDEARTLREFLVGQFHTDERGERTYDEATWGDAFFHFRTPNNHVLYSVLARASHQWLARPPVEATDAYFSETAIRLPAWVAALASVFALAGLGAVLGWRRAGWVASALLVLHPGFVRYAAEARGYALLLVFAPLLVVALARAVADGRWRWWGAAAALDFCLIYTWPLSAHFVLVANAGALVAIWWNRARPVRDRATLTLRWVVTGLAAFGVWLQLFLPNLVQLRIWLGGSSAKGAPGHGAWIDALCAMLTGRVWHETDASNPLLTPWSRTWQEQPWIVVGAGSLVVGALLIGVIALWRRSPAARPWLPALVLPPVFVLLQSGLSGSVLYPWYLVSAVPGVVLLMAIGLDAVALRCVRSAAGRPVFLGAAVLIIALTGARTRELLRRYPIEPNREAALLVQPVINPHHPDYQRHVLTAGFLMRNTIYDPGVREFATLDQMRTLMDEARESGRDFVVVYGQPGFARQEFPEIMAVLDDPAVFQHLATLPGQEAYCTRHVVKHMSGAR